MLLVDSQTLARHFVKGELTRTEFVALSASLARIDEVKKSGNVLKRCAGLICYSGELLRYTIKWRVRTVWRLIKYSAGACIVLCLAVIYRVDMNDLNYLAHAGAGADQILRLIIEGSPDRLPGDIQSAAAYMTGCKEWKWQHISQFRAMWDEIDAREKQVMRKTRWFQTFYVIALLKEAERKKLALHTYNGTPGNLSEMRSLIGALS